ncbi:CDP-diacylglycerol--glycerol-3-phosphate 3-phosphatidyltransferase [Halalkalibacter hemicellulosilyticus]|uniref:CDP-diacylglycerol--glycerol-3-phosphate 3-phosphatidyltransferase n=1 Tax=Halalkalibacter hemicellulosilyticusJCM 9152 TaxID=1236971 RepID=W4QFW1_9BACI|nr:CDP-diacylglycerol--glycerol-3-phosphate 3-phosphatidyltransferase [Halalkalibacter hemicellulosilyticus]GAE30822.1 CDP-diacylglycerol-glycerol-3-phosphate 3-phosphatidyltransferase [Halalkalibacter hemicellulosilyticusJCM 9152]
MNLPNKITISRICLIPIFMIILLMPSWVEVSFLGTEMPLNHLIAALIFILAAATDWLDGYYARKLGLVTNLGKFLDPLADKLLITAALIGLVELQLLPAWMAIIIISREFAVTGIRLVAAADGVVIAASSLGKLKTVIQIVAISALLLHNWPFQPISFPFAGIAIWAATIITVLSGVDYFQKNKQVLMNSND